MDTANADAFTCIRGACAAIVADNWKIVVVDRPDLAGPACDVADVVILAARSRMQECRSGARFVSQTTLRASGAIELNLGDHDRKAVDVLAAFAGPPRPWTAHRLYDWRTGTSAPGHAEGLSTQARSTWLDDETYTARSVIEDQ